MKLMADGYAKHGEVFTVPVLNRRITFLIGPDVVPHFFKGTDDEMSQTEVGGQRTACTVYKWWLQPAAVPSWPMAGAGKNRSRCALKLIVLSLPSCCRVPAGVWLQRPDLRQGRGV